MDWQRGMNQAIEYIENNLTRNVDYKAAAKFVGCSTWEFQRIFSFLTHISLGEYIRQRKLSLAAKDIQTSDKKIIDIALEYGYESPAAFSRAFCKLFGITPSSARNTDINLNAYSRITFESIEKGRLITMNKFSERGYVVRENGPVYFTKDMDNTIKWFEDILGWYGDIVVRDNEGNGDYGCVFDYPSEIAAAHIAPFRGFHLFSGEPSKGVAGFIMIDGIDALHKHVKDNGWNQISDITLKPWGARECSITTLDGCALRFFESTR
ncbi:MAG: helix-turn-helix domain-containing protein [Proteobacteria bacterium]|nr:helix-turn-helix domain-containing protein [Pseudomonadota bacterium]